MMDRMDHLEEPLDDDRDDAGEDWCDGWCEGCFAAAVGCPLDIAWEGIAP